MHEDDASLQRLKDLLRDGDYDARDASIDSGKPNEASNEQYIKQEILKPRIEWAGCVVVLIGPQTHESAWVNWEIEVANRLGKRIVGIYDFGVAQESPKLPAAFEKYGTALVGWQLDQVVGAINGTITNFKGGDGEAEREATHELPRYSCG